MCKLTIRQKVEGQIRLFDELQSNGFNIVNCGRCGSVNLHKIEADMEEIECAFCDFKSDPCDFPDFWYTGAELSSEFDEPDSSK